MRYPLACAALLLATAFLAGCVEPTPRPYEDPTVADDPDPAVSASGGSEPTDDEPAPAEEPEDEAPTSADPVTNGSAQNTMVTRTVTLEGRTPTRLCTRLYQEECRVIEPGHNTSVRLDTFPINGFLNGTLTWDADTPATSRLHAALVADGQYDYPHWGYGSRVATGKSPLQVSFDLSQWQGHRTLVIYHNSYCLAEHFPVAQCALAGSVLYSVAQDFTFDGQLTGWTTNHAARGGGSS